MAIKISIIEDDDWIRENLASQIRHTEGFVCSGCYRNLWLPPSWPVSPSSRPLPSLVCGPREEERRDRDQHDQRQQNHPHLDGQLPIDNPDDRRDEEGEDREPCRPVAERIFQWVHRLLSRRVIAPGTGSRYKGLS